MTFQPLLLAQRTISDRPGGGHVADVQPRADVRGEQAVAGDDRLLGDRRPAAQAEAAGELALVHLRVLGQPRLLGVLGDDAVERLDVLQRATHQHRVGDALAVVGEDPDPGGGVGHRTELGEPLAAEPDGDRADREDVAVPGLAAQPPHLLDDTGGVGDRVGVGHRVHRGEAAERRGLGAGLDGLGVLAAGLAQVGVQVDQAGQARPARRRRPPRRRPRPDRSRSPRPPRPGAAGRSARRRGSGRS